MSDTRLRFSADYEPYVVSDERLAEIRAMFTDRDEQDNWCLKETWGTTKADLLGAVYDLLGERDDRVVREASERDQRNQRKAPPQRMWRRSYVPEIGTSSSLPPDADSARSENAGRAAR